MKRNKGRFVIFAPSYDENSGGTIVLHKLAYLLDCLGESAYICPGKVGVRNDLNLWKRFTKKFKRIEFEKSPDFETKLIKESQITKNDIVVYPEVISGNPFKAKNVVRWLLHKPGFHTGEANFGSDDLIFAFDDYCIEDGYGIDPKNKLYVLSLNSSYALPHEKRERQGSCYMMRKGTGRSLVHSLEDSICVDGLSHAELAEIFQTTKYFYSYDELTLYSQYAALCGCISVVIPDKYKTRDEWVSTHPISKYGIAYGMDDIDHAIKTQSGVKDYFDQLEITSLESVKFFVDASKNYFNLG